MSETEESSVRKGQGPKVAIAQIAPVLGDLTANMEKHREAIVRAKDENVDLLVFPELSLTGYRLKDSVPEVALTRQCPEFIELADLSKDLSIVAGLVLESTEHFFFNASAYFEDGKVHFVHRKVYLPTYGMFDEQRYFARGNHIAAFPTKHGKMAILCCEDMLHPSALLVAALDGASVVIVPSASPARGVVEEGAVDANGRSWEEYNHAMARTYGIFVVHANRTGVEDGHTFWGGSELVGPSGETLAKAAYYQPDFVSAVLPESLQRRQRLQAPMLRDEDVDLTINELCRVRGRERPAARPQQRSEGGDARRHGGQAFHPGGQRDRGRGRGGPPRGGRDFRDSRGNRDNRGNRDDRGNRDNRGNRDDRGNRDNRGNRDDRGNRGSGWQGGSSWQQGRQDYRDRDDYRDRPDHRERLDPRERRPRPAADVARETIVDDGDDYLD